MANKWMEKLTKNFGAIASDLNDDKPVPVPAWSPSLNWALTTRGWIPGKINTVYGPESGGKSLICMMAIVQLQRQDLDAITIWFDSEYSFNPDFFAQLGGDLDRLVVGKSNDPLKIFDYMSGEMLELMQDGAPIKAVVVDSIKSIRYPKDIKKESTAMTMGGSGSIYLPAAIKMILPVIVEHKLLTFFVQQVTMQIDPMKAMRNPYVITEGMALKHASDTMIEVTKLETKAGSVESGETMAGGARQVGHKVRVKIRKNRLGVPARVAQFTLRYGKGITDIGGEIFDLAKSLGVIGSKTGNTIWFGDVAVGKGKDSARIEMGENLDLQSAVLEACYSYKDSPVEADASGFVEDEE